MPPSTHDTKRSEDVRARLAVLSELPEAWAARLDRWREWNRPLQPVVRGRRVPEGSAELLLYQTLLGAWPLDEAERPAFRERLRAYLVKAAREAKEDTSWLHPDEPYEDALRRFAEAILAEPAQGPFLRDFLPFQRVVAFYGAINGLTQVLLKIAVPGVPDFYQGTELWDFSLVDPDNRRPVDFEARARLLATLHDARGDRRALLGDMLANWQDGRVKLYLTTQGLRCRRDHAALFASGDYVPLGVIGARRDHVCAFARRLGGIWAVAVVPRLAGPTGGGSWAGTARTRRGWLRPIRAMTCQPLRLPLGVDVWGDTTLALPSDAPRRWSDV